VIAAITRLVWTLACLRVSRLHDAELYCGWREFQDGSLERAQKHFVRASEYADWLRRNIGRTQ
jgi:hypothetical protein